jgi:hypothetical protein
VAGVDVYATGVLSDLQVIGRCLNPLHRPPLGPLSGGWRLRGLRWALRRLRASAHHRACWRGYYAEGPPGVGRVGIGWTRRRALRDLQRHIAGSR